MVLIRRILRSRPIRRAARPLAVALFAIAVGALPLAGSSVAEASSSGDSHDKIDCEFSLGI